MKISVITLFPGMIAPVVTSSILGRAAKKGLVEYNLVNLRPFGEGVHEVVDGRPFGGGAGMVLRADILAKAVKSLLGKGKKPSSTRVVLTSASGQLYKQATARQLSKLKHLIIICGRYEGVDQRFIDNYVDLELSIGDYVVTGGEVPAMVIADSVVRLIPGVLKKEEATVDESFTDGLLEYPHYTRPAEFEGISVPAELITGHHQQVTDWRKEQSLIRTKKVRPDLLK